MGQCVSVASDMDQRGSGMRSSKRSLFKRRTKSSLSAAFNVLDTNDKLYLVNINTATIEELMTLPGITRTIAQSIIDHRQAIGKFSKVEDLALVSGVGAAKLNLIRREICVSWRKNLSRSVSCVESQDSVDMGDTNFHQMRRVVNVNKASIFDLMNLCGTSQELAANIIERRNKKGLYRSLSELLKVKGVDEDMCNVLRRCLALEGPVSNVPRRCSSELPITDNELSSVEQQLNAVHIENNVDSNSNKVFEFLSSRSLRRISYGDLTDYSENSMCLATWNLHRYTLIKSDNQGVREVICRTILENRLSIVAVQEVSDSFALKKICDELNHPSLHQVLRWNGPRGEWKFLFSHGSQSALKLGFLYNSSLGITSTDVIDVKIENGHYVNCDILKAVFQVKSFTLTLINVHLHSKSDGNNYKNMLESLKGDGEHVVIMGDFSKVDKSSNAKVPAEFQGVVPISTNTIVDSHCSTDGEKFHDNIFISNDMASYSTGHAGVVRNGLCHLAIPDGWSLNGPASQHCPVWCELILETATTKTEIITPPATSTLTNGNAHMLSTGQTADTRLL